MNITRQQAIINAAVKAADALEILNALLAEDNKLPLDSIYSNLYALCEGNGSERNAPE